MSELSAGDRLPEIVVTPPGPRSREISQRLTRFESPNITYISDDAPIVWAEAVGANVLDVDGNVYIDLTAGFGVAAAGHRNPRITAATRQQLDRLAHGLGDVHPSDIKVQLLERLAQVTPAGLQQSILTSSGAEAVEAALKTARLASGRPGVLCFSGAYHGLTYGALAVTDGDAYRKPFEDQIGIPIVRVHYPNIARPAPEVEGHGPLLDATLSLVAEQLDADERIGAIIVEPILGRGGTVIPPHGFLGGLREECDRRGLVLIFDEVFTGFGRTGRWFACEHEGVTPHILCVGKALSGAFPFSACIGHPDVMAAWPRSQGEAIHTSTFLGHPLACAAALAQIDEIEDTQLVERSAGLGAYMLERLGRLPDRAGRIGDLRGRGLLAAIELARDAGGPDTDRAAHSVRDALRRGLILLREGHVLQLSPPLTITERQLAFALDALEACLGGA